MPRDDLHICRKLLEGSFHCCDYAIYAAASLRINERKTVRHEIVTEVCNVRFLKIDDAVSIGVPGRKMQSANVFAVQMDRQVVLEGDDRQRGRRRGLVFKFHGGSISRDAARLQSLAHI